MLQIWTKLLTRIILIIILVENNIHKWFNYFHNHVKMFNGIFNAKQGKTEDWTQLKFVFKIGTLTNELMSITSRIIILC